MAEWWFCEQQSIKGSRCHLWDTVPAACSTDRCLPGSLNVWDLSVSISQLISLVHIAAASAAQFILRSVSTCSHRPRLPDKAEGVWNTSAAAGAAAWPCLSERQRWCMSKNNCGTNSEIKQLLKATVLITDSRGLTSPASDTVTQKTLNIQLFWKTKPPDCFPMTHSARQPDHS